MKYLGALVPTTLPPTTYRPETVLYVSTVSTTKKQNGKTKN